VGNGAYFVDDDYDSYYYVNAYYRRNIGWSERQKAAFANILVAKWVELCGRSSEALINLQQSEGFAESIMRAAAGYLEK
jgi:hypothetical protein